HRIPACHSGHNFIAAPIMARICTCRCAVRGEHGHSHFQLSLGLVLCTILDSCAHSLGRHDLQKGDRHVVQSPPRQSGQQSVQPHVHGC
ncbi:hypothetical protein BG003_003428, partial [Podila horticola]